MRQRSSQTGGRLESRPLTSRRNRWERIALALAALLALGAPGATTQTFAGLPLSALGLLAAALVAYASVALPSPGRRAAAALAIGFVVLAGVKFTAHTLEPPSGLLASYWPSAQASGAPERSTDFGWLNGAATRVDSRLSLRGEDFAVHFFNDAARFNFAPDQVPGRDQLPFSVRWDGWLVVPSDGSRQFTPDSARVAIDDQDVTGAISLTAGLHPIRVDYVRPEARVPRVEVRWQREVGGPLEVLGANDLRWRDDSIRSDGVSRILGGFADISFAGLIAAWLVLGVRGVAGASQLSRWRAAIGLLPLGFLAYGMLLHAPLVGHATVLSGLDDWLIYESSARDILLNGWLMDGGQGHAPAFYGQPLYPYLLALAHRLTGEGLFGPLALQYATLGLVVALTAELARRAFGSFIAGLAAGAALLVLLQLEAEHFKVARQLFTENAYMPLVMASLIAMVALARSRIPPVWWRALLVGVLLGLTAIARSQFLLFVPFGLLILVLIWRRRAVAPVACRLVGLMAAILPVTARNLVVSGQLVLISSSGGASLLEFHRPPAGLIDQAALAKDPLYEALHLDTSTRTVLAFIRADPRGYLATLLPLGAHSIGLQGRNDPGIYWPLFLTCLTDALSFALVRVRRLWVWPIHAFVISHLVVLMLFEADTYGYRLVMPMYAPMVAVAAQLPLAGLQALFALRRDRPRTVRVSYAAVGWSLLAALALAWQTKALVDVWPQRDAFLHGLGGAAFNAARVADDTSASSIYLASIDGTPRRVGAGTLLGLRYPWFKWFDPVRSLPLPRDGETAVYALNELGGHEVAGDLTRCLPAADANGIVAVSAGDAAERCARGASASEITFDGLARVTAIDIPAQGVAGTPLDARLIWQPLVRHPDPQQFSLQLDDAQAGDGIQWGNGTLEVYPASEWEPDETLLSRIPIATDATALPQSYRVTLGMGPTKAGAPQSTTQVNGQRTQRVPVASVRLTPGSLAQLPSDMRAVQGLSGQGLALIAARPLPEEASIGGPLRLGLLWQATTDAPQIRQFDVRLLRANGEVVQDTPLAILGGRIEPSALHDGNVVRDEQSLVISARAPAETLTLAVGLDGRSVNLGTVKVTGRAHTFDDAGSSVKGDFGGLVGLVSASIEPANARPNDKITIKLRWRAEAEIDKAYKVFVHVLDPSGTQVVAQRDAEPQDGRAPTTGWVSGEAIDDEYAIALPPQLAAGDYPVEIGLYDAKSGDRLGLKDGESRLVLETRLHVAP